MPKVTVYGASDDCVEIEGDIKDEFNLYDKPGYLAFSEGTVLEIEYTESGIWRINRIVAGSATFSKTEGADPEGEYTDRVTLEGDIQCVTFGDQIARVKRKKEPTL